jgi:hypothetical protein
MSNDALQQRLAVYAAEAARTCPALASKNLTPTSCAIMWMAGLCGRQRDLRW